ncbi:hypothetical protein VKT23_012780 [Stygiomarasmius scandens]|uniref:Uncharacterized protein n=1 Tax=Marasmiellus scandens TaxID=2682957 RepID=A0ABR1J982_9AGAR
MPNRRNTLDNVTQQVKAMLAALESTIERIEHADSDLDGNEGPGKEMSKQPFLLQRLLGIVD